MRCFYAHIMTNGPSGTLYVGVTNDMARRAREHRAGIFDGFAKRYGLKRLVYFQMFDSIAAEVQRVKNVKHWPRALPLEKDVDGRDKHGHDVGWVCAITNTSHRSATRHRRGAHRACRAHCITSFGALFVQHPHA